VERVITCDCGFEARAADEDGLVTEVWRHAFETHRMVLSRDEALLLAFRAELNVIDADRGFPHEHLERRRSDEVEMDPRASRRGPGRRPVGWQGHGDAG
jgi:hypothetical protein